ncbi:MAG: DUF1801 domain-containing protein [Acidimicrobiales bacterium]|nr:DUF1801 domain-containing protein [Acidimicrobiales bacterium]
MAKMIKADSSRKPPEPEADHTGVDEWMRKLMPDLQPIVEHLDKTIRKAFPKAQFAVKWKKAHYGLPDKGWILEIVSYDVSVNVMFYAGSEFDTPPPMGEGRGRYVKLKSLDEAKAKEVTAWIKQAGTIDGWQ